MSAPLLQFFEDGGSTPLTGLQALVTGAPGVAGTETVYDIWNNKGGAGADTAHNRYLVPLTRNAGATNFVGSGHEAVENRWFELRILEGLGGLTLAAGPRIPVGAGRDFRLPSLANDRGVKVAIRDNSPGVAASRHVEGILGIERRLSTPLPFGLTEAFGAGISMGLFDGEASWLLRVVSNVVENPGGVDDQVRVDDVVWVAKGVPFTKVRHLVQLNDEDGAATTLTSGRGYWALIYASEDGTIAVEKGIEAASPTKPATPADSAGGELGRVAYVRREFDGLIHNADIENVHQAAAGHLSVSGTTGTVGPRLALVDNRLIETATADQVALTDDDTNYVWCRGDGSLAVSQAEDDKPEARATLWHVATLASGVVTAQLDRRPWLAFGHRIERHEFRFDATLAGGQKQRSPYRGNRRAYIVPLGGIGFYVLGSGTGTGGTVVDTNLRAPGGSFTTVHTSQGSEDRRATIASAASVLSDTNALPEVLAVEPDTVLEMEIDAVPGTSTPAAAWGAVLLAVG